MTDVKGVRTMYRQGGEKVYQQRGADPRGLASRGEGSLKVVGLHEAEIDGWGLAKAGGGVGSSPEVPRMRSRA